MVVLIIIKHELPPEDERHMIAYGPFDPAEALAAEQRYRKRNRIAEDSDLYTFSVCRIFDDVLPLTF